MRLKLLHGLLKYKLIYYKDQTYSQLGVGYGILKMVITDYQKCNSLLHSLQTSVINYTYLSVLCKT